MSFEFPQRINTAATQSGTTKGHVIYMLEHCTSTIYSLEAEMSSFVVAASLERISDLFCLLFILHIPVENEFWLDCRNFHLLSRARQSTMQ